MKLTKPRETRAALMASIALMAERAGVSLSRLALNAGLDSSTLSHLRCMDQWPSMKMIAALCKASGTSPDRWAYDLDCLRAGVDPSGPRERFLREQQALESAKTHRVLLEIAEP